MKYFFKGIDVDIAGYQYATSGAWIAFHASDHGLVAIEKRGIGIAPGTIAKLGLKQKKVMLQSISSSNQIILLGG